MEQSNTSEVSEPRIGQGTLFKWVPALAATIVLAACVEVTPSAPPPVSASPTVTIEGKQFNADHVTIEAGDTVTWVWDDGDRPHDVSGDGFKSEVQSEGSFIHTFHEVGTYPCVCTLHSGMKATVTVVAPS